jgi:DNA-directed RNA polymerase specialized sigma24 family protein
METLAPTDLQLISLLKAGSREAGDALVERYRRLVARAVYDVIRDLTAVEDLIQDIFVKAIRKVDLYKPEQGKFGVWLTTVARNETINHLRKLKRSRIMLLEKATPANSISPADQPSRTILTKRILESASFEAIARLLGRPTETVKSIFYRTTAVVRERVGTLA